MIYLNFFIVPWSYFLYIFKHFLLLVLCNHQGSAIMLLLEVWLSFAWIGINMLIHVNIRYFEISHYRVGLSTSIYIGRHYSSPGPASHGPIEPGATSHDAWSCARAACPRPIYAPTLRACTCDSHSRECPIESQEWLSNFAIWLNIVVKWLIESLEWLTKL
jgi:hypothetical protein